MRVAWLKDLRLADLPQVGGKNASLGEMTAALSEAGIRVPGGFATTADAFREFLSANKLGERIDARLNGLNASTCSPSPRIFVRGPIEARRATTSPNVTVCLSADICPRPH